MEKIKETLTEKLKELCPQYGIDFTKIGSRDSVTDDKPFFAISHELMTFAGIPTEYQDMALYGMPVPPFGAETEFRGHRYNWSSMYDYIMLEYVLNFSIAYVNGTPWTEVGLKYPSFKPHLLLKKYKLACTGTFEPQWSRDKYKDEPADCERRIIFDVYENEDRTIAFAFPQGRIGQGGYAAAVFATMEQVRDFAKWFLSKKSFFIKDLDLFNNGISAFGAKDRAQHIMETIKS